MADTNESQPVLRSTKPVSEALLNEKVRSRFHDVLSVVVSAYLRLQGVEYDKTPIRIQARLHTVPASNG